MNLIRFYPYVLIIKSLIFTGCGVDQNQSKFASDDDQVAECTYPFVDGCSRKTITGANLKYFKKENSLGAGWVDPDNNFGPGWEDPSGVVWGKMIKKISQGPIFFQTVWRKEDRLDQQCASRSGELPTESDIRRLQNYLFDANGGFWLRGPQIAYECESRYGRRPNMWPSGELDYYGYKVCGFDFWTIERKAMKILETYTASTTSEDKAHLLCIRRRQ